VEKAHVMLGIQAGAELFLHGPNEKKEERSLLLLTFAEK
jgi:hypothetical protein